MQDKQRLLEALEQSNGIVKYACDKAKISRGTHYNWLNEDEVYKLAVDNINNLNLDFAESKLFELISEGNLNATIFYLKCKGKSRGYQERAVSEIEFTERRIFTSIDIDVIESN